MQGKLKVAVAAIGLVASGSVLADITGGGGGFVALSQGPVVLDTGGGASYTGTLVDNHAEVTGGLLALFGNNGLDSGGFLTDDGRAVRDAGTGSTGHNAKVLVFDGGAGGLETLGVWGGAAGLLNGTPVGGGGGGLILTDNILGGSVPGLPSLPGLPGLGALGGILP